MFDDVQQQDSWSERLWHATVKQNKWEGVIGIDWDKWEAVIGIDSYKWEGVIGIDW